IPQAISNMTGNMGAVAPELKGIVRNLQHFVQLASSKQVSSVPTFYLSSRANACTVLLSVDRYMDVLSRVGADAVTWGKALSETLKDRPGQVYQMIFTETSVVSPCSKLDLIKIDQTLKQLDQVKLPSTIHKGIPSTVIDLSSLPITSETLARVTGRHRTEK